MCNCGCSRRKLNSVVGSASAWTTLAEGASTGQGAYVYAAGYTSRFRTEEFGKVGRIQFYISNPSPGTIVATTSIATLPAALATGNSLPGGGVATAPFSTPSYMFPVAVSTGQIGILAAATILEVSSDALIIVDMTFPLD